MTEQSTKSGLTPKVQGQELLTQLREGWSPMPTKTLFAMAIGGLRVRIMRSAVTMLSIVLAIAFLAYTGLANKQTYNLAVEAQRLQDMEQGDVAAIAPQIALAIEADPVSKLDDAARRSWGKAFGMASFTREQLELTSLRTSLELAAEGFAVREQAYQDAIAVPDLSPIDRIEQDAQIQRARDDLAATQGRYDAAARVVRIGLWLTQGKQRAEDTTLALAELDVVLRERFAGLLQALGATERFRWATSSSGNTDNPLTLPLAERLVNEVLAGTGVSTEALQRAIEEERIRRQATEMKNLIRGAGLSMEDVLSGNPLDTWLIIMAMVTCAVGIANAMLMSVTERFREIGTMKCLGAQDGLVVKLFLLESGVLGIVGAVAGIFMGFIVALLAAILLYGGYGLRYFPLGSDAFFVIVMSLLGGVVLSVIGAVGPAWQASNMRPVDALRVEE